jgi:hypothetical protein
MSGNIVQNCTNRLNHYLIIIDSIPTTKEYVPIIKKALETIISSQEIIQDTDNNDFKNTMIREIVSGQAAKIKKLKENYRNDKIDKLIDQKIKEKIKSIDEDKSKNNNGEISYSEIEALRNPGIQKLIEAKKLKPKELKEFSFEHIEVLKDKQLQTMFFSGKLSGMLFSDIIKKYPKIIQNKGIQKLVNSEKLNLKLFNKTFFSDKKIELILDKEIQLLIESDELTSEDIAKSSEEKAQALLSKKVKKVFESRNLNRQQVYNLSDGQAYLLFLSNCIQELIISGDFTLKELKDLNLTIDKAARISLVLGNKIIKKSIINKSLPIQYIFSNYDSFRINKIKKD